MRTGTVPVLMLELFGVGVWNIVVEGKQHLEGDEQAPIIVTNHIAVLDPVVTSYVFRLPAQISKIDNLDFPLMGMVVRGSQSLCVDREARSSRSEVQKAILTRTTEPGWPPLLIYPEGVCSNGEALLEFKTGAFLPGLPVQPVALSYPYKHFNPSWTNGSALQVIGHVMAQFVNRAHVKILPTYYPNDAEKKDPKLFAEGVRQKIATALNIPVTPCTLLDMQICQLPFIRKKYKVHTNSRFLVGSAHLFEVFPKTTPQQLQEWALQFCQADEDGDSLLNYEEYSHTEALGPANRDVWDLICQGSEKLKFRNFAYACATLHELGKY